MARGRILLDRGLIRKDKSSMMEIKKWMHDNYDIAKELMNENKRYVFHRLSYESGPVGAEGVVLTAGRSLAVDENYIPVRAVSNDFYGYRSFINSGCRRQGNCIPFLNW